jgi:hypothetical protein
MKYMFVYENGNGYHCGCCRRTSEAHDTQEFENDEACLKYVESYNKGYSNNRWDNDSRVEEVHQMFGEGKQIYP